MQSVAASENTPVRIVKRIESPRKGSGILALVRGEDSQSFRFSCVAECTD
jgi:hypothetical protein